MSQDSCTITGPLGKVLRVLSVVGITPIILTRNPLGYVGTLSRRFPFGKYIVIPLLGISITLYFLIQFLFLLTEANIDTSTLIKRIEDTVQLSFSTLVIAIAIFNGPIRVKQTIKHLNRIEEVNYKLQHNTGYFNNNQKFLVSCFFVLNGCIIVGSSWNIYYMICAAKADRKYLTSIFSIVLRMILLLAVVLIEMQFVLKVCLLNETIRVLNKKFYDLIFKYDVFGSVMMYSTEDYLEARSYCHIYLTIRHIIYKINKQEGLILILLLTIYFNNTIHFVHYLTAKFDFEIPIISLIINIVMMIDWFLVIILPLLLLVEPCHQTSQEVQNIHNLLSQLMSTSMQRQLSKDFCIFSQQYLQHSPVFRAFGMVTLTRPLFLKIAGSILTYISLISQFNLGGEERFLKI